MLVYYFAFTLQIRCGCEIPFENVARRNFWVQVFLYNFPGFLQAQELLWDFLKNLFQTQEFFRIFFNVYLYIPSLTLSLSQFTARREASFDLLALLHGKLFCHGLIKFYLQCHTFVCLHLLLPPQAHISYLHINIIKIIIFNMLIKPIPSNITMITHVKKISTIPLIF